MATQQTALLWAALSAAALLYGMAWAQSGPSVPMKYCAAVNTGADMEPINWNWQSDGRCAGNCTDLKYAFAIVLEKDCWCSNLAPNKADQRSIGDCDFPCPGYPSDLCGGFGVYGYMEVAGARPSGTAPAGGSSTPTSTNTAASSTSSRPSSSASSASSTTTDDTGAIMTTITVSGTVKTVTATPSATGGSSSSPDTTSGSSGLKTGAIVGIVIGVLAGLAVLGLFLYLFLAKRRQRSPSPTPPHTPSGVLPSPRGTASATPQTNEISEAYTPGGGGSMTPAGAWTPGGKRRSHLMPVDPRLDPFAKGIYTGGAGGERSRESFNSLRDDQDYSRRVHVAPRVLRATNPDPEDD